MKRGERAVVVGGSIAGLLAARALSPHFREVIVVERDRFPDGPDFRAGVPQGRHAHLLLDRGRQILEAFFPGVQAEMMAGGALTYDVARDFSFISWAGDMVRFESGVPFLAVSRIFLEHHLRRRVLALPNVTARQGVTLTGLSGSAQKVTGVHLEGGEPLPAELVVDAGGRRSNAPEWLRRIGIVPPRETLVKPFLGYASRYYEAPATAVWDRVAMIASALPPTYTRGAGVIPIESGRFIVTLLGMNGDYPPTDEEGFAEFARSVPVPPFHAWLDAARPQGAIHGFRFDQNRLRHFEDCPLPSGYIAVGDAVASFNPIYGQGMTVSAMGAELLAQVLDEPVAAGVLPRVYHRRLAKLLRHPWGVTTTEDLRFPGTEGKRPFGQGLAYAYIDRLFLLAARDPKARLALLHVFGMTRPSSDLFQLPLAIRAMTTRIPPTLLRPQQALRTGTT